MHQIRTRIPKKDTGAFSLEVEAHHSLRWEDLMIRALI